MNVTFTVGIYDRAGDLTEDGIYLHFGDTMVRVADDLPTLELFQENITRIVTEVAEKF